MSPTNKDNFGIPLDTPPMEAKLTETLPTGDGWLFEPKWDGFRCIAFRNGDQIELQSKSGKPLARYFPDVVEQLRKLDAERFVLDGEIVIPIDGSLSFDDLLLRIHPAESRVNTLAAATPASLIVFDLMLDEKAESLMELALKDRRERLDRFADEYLSGNDRVRLSPATSDRAAAAAWLKENRACLDGVMAKRLDATYQAGNRNGMQKIKTLRTVDCVVGGFRWAKSGDLIGSMLLGLYNDDGELDHIGFCSALNAKRKQEATTRMKKVAGGPGFTGNAPQGASRWRSEEDAEWVPVEPSVVVEVRYDHFSGGRFRHGTRFLRWRPDKDPRSCTRDQLSQPGGEAMRML